MKLPFGLVLINNCKGEKVVIDIKQRVKEVYLDGAHNDAARREAAYAAYRAITGVKPMVSLAVVRPWIRDWEEEQLIKRYGLLSNK
jgi:hypothetical protein